MTSSASVLPRNLKLDLSTRNAQTVALAAVSAFLASSLILPAVLPSRIQLWGIHSVNDWFAKLWRGKEHRHRAQRDSLERWIASERSYAWKRLLSNIAPPGCDKGCVVASPSKKDPDYWYQWTRDSAMVFSVVIEQWKHGAENTEFLEQLIMDYIHESKKMQRKETPSGGYKTGGLGEVKYHVNGEPYRGSWGRPQNDGPALRARALTAVAHHLLDVDQSVWESFIKRELYDSLPYTSTQSIVKADLDYVCDVWQDQCFDLWEEVNGVHHFNMMVTIRALLDGSTLAARLGDTESAERYKTTAEDIEETLPKFWDEDRGYLQAVIDVKDDRGKHSGLDTGTVLGFLHSGNLSAIHGESHSEEYLGSDKSLASVHAVAQSMRDIYTINRRWYPESKGFIGFGIGRYQEDVYDGDGKRKTGIGNPWYLCTLAHAEFHYRLVKYFRNKAISINALTKPFWMSLGYFTSPEESELLEQGQTYDTTSTEHVGLLEALRDKGDAYVSVVRDQARWDGGLWEQFDRENGVEMGAPHLTWSYAAFLSCIAARDGAPMFE